MTDPTRPDDGFPDDWTPEDHDDLLAAEYVLGVLTGDDWRAMHDRAQIDGGFAARVAGWEARLSGLNDSFPDMPAPDLLPQIEARLFPTVPARRRFAWPWLAGAAVAASVALAVLIWPQPPAPMSVQLVGDSAAFAARFDGSVLEFALDVGAAGQGRDYQLWAIGADGVPRSLGLLRGPVTQVAADLPAGITLAVSLEPEGGAPGLLPTGPVLATGVLPVVN
ncbi:MAG: anti-sigma factor [Rhodobacteraceae bacterium]|jgi:anti-sigma-K factor RskA|nr:anti-sigma factor [Paracoccaceae bacterium]